MVLRRDLHSSSSFPIRSILECALASNAIAQFDDIIVDVASVEILIAVTLSHSSVTFVDKGDNVDEVKNVACDIDGYVRHRIFSKDVKDDDEEEMHSIASGSNDWLDWRGVGMIDVQLSSPLSNPSMVSEGGGSLSSNGDDDYLKGNGGMHSGGGGGGGVVQVDALQYKFYQYKNEDLGNMRNGIEMSVYGAKGMMSLAMT